jgi:hypothetical protein
MCVAHRTQLRSGSASSPPAARCTGHQDSRSGRRRVSVFRATRSRFPRMAARLAFVALSEGTSPTIWVRPLDSTTARRCLAPKARHGCSGRPDSRRNRVFPGRQSEKVTVTGERPELIANGPFRDGAWSSNGTILLGGQVGRPLFGCLNSAANLLPKRRSTRRRTRSRTTIPNSFRMAVTTSTFRAAAFRTASSTRTLAQSAPRSGATCRASLAA